MTAFLLITFLALPANQSAAPDPSLMQNAKLLALLKSLHELTPQTMTDAKLDAHLRELIKPLETRDLGRVALLADAMKTGLAEDEPIDAVYWRAYWACTALIAERNDEDSGWLLETLAARTHGVELERLKELMKQQRARPATKTKD